MPSVGQTPDPGVQSDSHHHKGHNGGGNGGGGNGNGGHRSEAEKVLDHALHWLGVPYQWGGTSKSGVDCSGQVQQVYSKMGVNLPRIANDQARFGHTVSAANARPGDLVYFENNASEPGIDHIGIYIGHGKMIVAPHTGTNVQIQDVGTATGFDRVLPDSAFKGMKNNAGQYVWHPSNGQTIGQAAMGVSHSASSGNAADGVGGGGGPSQNVSKGDIKQGLNSLGFASQLIHSNGSLTDAFHEIINKELDLSSSAGRSRAINILQNTDWYQNHTKAQRQFDELKYSDPKTWQNNIDQARAALKTQAGQMGLDLSPEELDHLATMVTRNGMTTDETNQALAKQFDYNKGDAYTGEAGQSIDAIRKLASDYYVPISGHQLQHYTRQTLSGALDPTTLTDVFRQQAASLYPYLTKQLQTHTVADIADPYKQLMANTLEINPTEIKQNDPSVLKALQSKDAEGNLGLMPLWQFQNNLYDDPRWMHTQNAHESLIGTTGDILQKMGLIT